MSKPIDLRLDGKVALITGGGSGLGFQYSEALAHQGASLILVGRTEASLAATTKALPGKHRYVVGDLSTDAVYEELSELAGEVDILVNNAGGAIKKTSWLTQSPEDFRATLEINVVASARLAQLVGPGMMERGWGRIINVASVYGMVAVDPRNSQPGMDSGAYEVAKHGVVGLTHFLATRLATHGVTVNTVSPGMFPRTLSESELEEKPWKRPTPGRRERHDNLTPMNRPGGSRDLGSVVVFLASPDSSFVTGQNIAVDGGWTTW